MGQGGDWEYNHHFCYSLKVSPKGKDTILIEQYEPEYEDEYPVTSLFEDLSYEKQRLEVEEATIKERRKSQREKKKRENFQKIGKKSLQLSWGKNRVIYPLTQQL